jgi:hypothetical protein
MYLPTATVDQVYHLGETLFRAPVLRFAQDDKFLAGCGKIGAPRTPNNEPCNNYSVISTR